MNCIHLALTEGFAKDKWTHEVLNTNSDLHELFEIFVETEEVN